MNMFYLNDLSIFVQSNLEAFLKGSFCVGLCLLGACVVCIVKNKTKMIFLVVSN